MRATVRRRDAQMACAFAAFLWLLVWFNLRGAPGISETGWRGPAEPPGFGSESVEIEGLLGEVDEPEQEGGPAEAGNPAAACASTTLIQALRLDPCYVPKNRASLRRCNCRSDLPIANKVTYQVPDEQQTMNQSVVEQRAILVFIHVNKAGGSTVKKDILFPSVQRNGWDGAGFGMFKAWPGLGSPWSGGSPAVWRGGAQRVARFAETPREVTSEPLYMQCGKPVAHPPARYEDLNTGGGCPLRVIWGSMSIGLCQHFPGRPCFYLVTLRDPFKRAVSNYNYVCVQGAEGRKKWRQEWKQRGECPLDMRQFFDIGLGEPDFLLWRLTRACDTGCGVEAAVRNLRHPCVRYLILEEFDDGLRRLRELLGAPYDAAIQALQRSRGVVNKASYHDRVKAQLADADLVADIRTRLSNDIAIYEAARKHYKDQWAQPLASCNAF